MTLTDISPVSQCRVLSASTDSPALQSRLYALGLYPGVELTVLRLAPAGDPMQVRIGSTLLSIRLQEAANVEVEAMT